MDTRVYTVGNEAKPTLLATLPESVRQRSVCARDGGLLAWAQGEQLLYAVDACGRVSGRWELKAASVWMSATRVLARSELYEDGAGFSYTLYEYSDARGPIALGSWSLDLFPADVVFAADGRVVLAGANAADTTHTLWAIAGSNAQLVLEFPKDMDFARLVAHGPDLFVFTSSGAKTHPAPKAHRFWRLSQDGRIDCMDVRGLPAGALRPYGSGFSLGDTVCIPWAMDNGQVNLVCLVPNGTQLDTVALAEDARGVYAVLGADSSDGSMWYLAMDWAKESGKSWLGNWDGKTLNFFPMP